VDDDDDDCTLLCCTTYLCEFGDRMEGPIGGGGERGKEFSQFVVIECVWSVIMLRMGWEKKGLVV
jgi:hypothetical protein